MFELNKIYNGDSLEVLKTFPSDFIDCVVTSPQRDNRGRFAKGYHWRNKKDWWDYAWFYREYITLGKSCLQIAKENNTTKENMEYWVKRHGIPTRDMATIRKNKKWGLSGKNNGMYGKTKEQNPNWKGGITEERQSFYATAEWKDCVKRVYKRDNAVCQNCGCAGNLHIHHIRSFKNKEYRATLSNLILVCKSCHSFIHSKKNTNKIFIERD